MGPRSLAPLQLQLLAVLLAGKPNAARWAVVGTWLQAVQLRTCSTCSCVACTASVIFLPPRASAAGAATQVVGYRGPSEWEHACEQHHHGAGAHSCLTFTHSEKTRSAQSSRAARPSPPAWQVISLLRNSLWLKWLAAQAPPARLDLQAPPPNLIAVARATTPASR
jgi:hypothetical protein